jgi:FkbM family methyltransferase
MNILKRIEKKAYETLFVATHKNSKILKTKFGKFAIKQTSDLFYLTPYYEPEVLKIINKLENTTFIDIGAHMGIYTIMAGRKNNVVAFEPDVRRFQQLQENVQLNNLPSVTTFNFGCYSRNGDFSFDESSSAIKEDKLTDSTIYAMALDSIRTHLGKIGLIKIDTEGAEYQVLLGAKTILQKHKPSVIFEANEINELEKIKDFLAKFGYMVYQLDERNYLAKVCNDRHDIPNVKTVHHKMRRSAFWRLLKFELLTSKLAWRAVQLYCNHLKYILIDYGLALDGYISKNKKISFESPRLDNISFLINPTNICNAKCVFCAYRKISDKKFVMDFETFKNAVDEFASAGGKFLGLTPTLGEALLDSKLIEKIEYAKKKGLNIRFFTNGFLLNKNDNYKKLIDSGVDNIDISVGDINTKLDAKIYGVSEDLSRERWAGIAKLLDYCFENNCVNKICISFRPLRAPYQIVHDKDFKKFLDYLGKDIDRINFTFSFDNWGGSVIDTDLIGIMKFRRPIKNRVYPCCGLYGLAVLPNGDVRLCGCRAKDTLFDELVVGNIHSQSLANILKSAKVKNLRENFCNGDYPSVCKNCSLYVPLKHFIR